MNSLLACRMKRAVFLRDARSRLLHFFTIFLRFFTILRVMPNVIAQISKE